MGNNSLDRCKANNPDYGIFVKRSVGESHAKIGAMWIENPWFPWNGKIKKGNSSLRAFYKVTTCIITKFQVENYDLWPLAFEFTHKKGKRSHWYAGSRVPTMHVLGENYMPVAQMYWEFGLKSLLLAIKNFVSCKYANMPDSFQKRYRVAKYLATEGKKE